MNFGRARNDQRVRQRIPAIFVFARFVFARVMARYAGARELVPDEVLGKLSQA